MISGESTVASRYRSVTRRTAYRLDLWLSVGLFLLTFITRLPLRSQTLYHWDSINFAYALEKLDIAQGQPHPPGYIGYVWLGRLTDLLFSDPQATFVWLSMVGSGLAVAALYLFGRRWLNRRVGLVAALFLASSPLFWFYGEIALPHALDGLFAILSAWLLFEIMEGRRQVLMPAAVVLAVAGALRQQTPVFLAPLALYAGYLGLIKPLGWQKAITTALPAVALFGLLCTLWFFPLIDSAGGLVRYQEIVGDFTAEFNTTTSIFMQGGGFGLTRNLRKLITYTLYGWSVALIPLAIFIAARLLRRRWSVEWRRVGFLVAWIGPSLIFYTLIHMGQQGLVFVFLPALLLASAQATVRLLEQRTLTTLIGATTSLVVINAAIFILLPEYPLPGDRVKLLTRDTIVNQDTYVQSRIDLLHAQFPPEQTVVVAANWRHVMYYLPEYPRVAYDVVSKWELGAGGAEAEQQQQHSLDDLGLTNQTGPASAVLFDPSLSPFDLSPERTRAVSLPDGQLLYLELEPGESLYTGPEGIRVVEKP